MRRREIERGAIARGEQRLFVTAAAVPYWPNGVDDVARFQPIPARDLGRAGLAAAQHFAFFVKLRSCRAVDGAIDPTAAQ
jgi:hypothetical protein